MRDENASSSRDKSCETSDRAAGRGGRELARASEGESERHRSRNIDGDRGSGLERGARGPPSVRQG